jgi:hypothetical protein
MNGATLARVTLGDTEYLVGAAAPAPPRRRSAHLLPNYDEYFIGHRDRSAIGARLRDLSIVMGGNALIPHVVVADGQLVGTWKRITDKKGLVVELRALTRLTTAESARVLAAARRLETFHERPVDVRLR